ncbi:zinc-binding dehydrogenase [Natrinema caseinilyticum]|uniref:zinc-binding dehydrogenase n=1 Tax=Natrinema caseinilyticum TaxID=2961570 RepID=UPI0020C4DFBA|nr:zinc-binding dehydrogenase [Natrinema caseinilyticum]
MQGRAVVQTDTRSVEIQEFDLPTPEPRGILTEVVRTNICGSDLHFWKGDFPYRGILGHEAAVRVSELGEDVETDSRGTPIEEGDLVAPVYFIPCGACYACQSGEFAACVNQGENMMQRPDESPHFHATFSTHYYIKPEQYFYKVPENVPEAIAASANCALSQVVYGFDEAGVQAGDDVVIQGAGGLGLHATAVARERNANPVVVEGVGERIETLEQFRPSHIIDMREFETVKDRVEEVERLTEGNGADVALEVAGVADAFSEGIRFLKNTGTYVEIGNISFGESTEFTPSRLTWNSRTAIGVAYYQPWYLGKALDFLSKHIDEYPYEELTGAEFTLDDVTEAMQKAANREVTRAALLPQR